MVKIMFKPPTHFEHTYIELLDNAEITNLNAVNGHRSNGATVTKTEIGITNEKRRIYQIEIRESESMNTDKPSKMIESGIHPNE